MGLCPGVEFLQICESDFCDSGPTAGRPGGATVGASDSGAAGVQLHRQPEGSGLPCCQATPGGLSAPLSRQEVPPCGQTQPKEPPQACVCWRPSVPPTPTLPPPSFLALGLGCSYQLGEPPASCCQLPRFPQFLKLSSAQSVETEPSSRSRSTRAHPVAFPLETLRLEVPLAARSVLCLLGRSLAQAGWLQSQQVQLWLLPGGSLLLLDNLSMCHLLPSLSTSGCLP